MKISSLLFFGLACLSGSVSAAAPDAGPPLAPGYAGLDYVLPEAGAYRLPPLGDAADGAVIDADGGPMRLHQVFGDRIVLLSFIYTRCSDVNGCPLSNHIFYRLKSEMEYLPAVASRLRLVSLSFDPESDTPEALRRFGAGFSYAGNAGDWRFVTTESEVALQPLLAAYRQDIQKNLTRGDEGNGDISHVLRVFLIDANKRIRNIYSVAFLHPDLLLTDVRTLIGEERKQPAGIRAGGVAVAPIDLLHIVRHPPLGLPAVPWPDDNPPTAGKIALGRRLFFDRRLSFNDTISCAMCHVPDQGFTSNALATAVGIEGRSVRRNTPTLYNVAYLDRLFHDGREESLEQQVWGPLLARNEMGNPSVGHVLEKVRRIPGYVEQFRAAFAGRGVGMETLGMALAAYQRSLLAADSAFDRWRYAGQRNAMDASAKRGFGLFTGKAGCAGCHLVGGKHALFTDQRWHNTGVGYRQSMGRDGRKRTVMLAPGVSIAIDSAIIDAVAAPVQADLGRYEISQDPGDRWKYRTPSLRNLTLTAPYMHNGSLRTLEAVVAFYDRGGVPNETLDPLIHPLHLSAAEKSDLVAFLRSLTGRVETLVADVAAAPIGDIARKRRR